jgi:hypothetical protein
MMRIAGDESPLFVNELLELGELRVMLCGGIG